MKNMLQLELIPNGLFLSRPETVDSTIDEVEAIEARTIAPERLASIQCTMYLACNSLIQRPVAGRC